MTDFVLVEKPADRVAHVILNRPERRNALIGPLATQLADTLIELNADESLSVLVIRGAGGAFCSGLDLKEFGLDKPWLKLEIVGKAGKKVVLTVSNTGKTADKDRYAVVTSTPGVLLLPADSIDKFAKTLKDFKK